jgi:hypothetical protein
MPRKEEEVSAAVLAVVDYVFDRLARHAAQRA